MREVVLVFPDSSVKGHNICEITKLREDLLFHFGGFSEYAGQGQWTDKYTRFVESHVRFVVAVKNSSAQRVAVDLLKYAAKEMGERAVYWVGMDGEAHVDDLS